MTAIPSEVLRQIQWQLLVAVLNQSPLPGQSDVLRFPDLALILEQPEPIVSRENLVGEADATIPVRVLTEAEIGARARELGQMPALRFREPEMLGNRVRLALELRMYFRDVEPLPLGAVIATFAEVPAVGWQAVEPPAALGY